MPDNPHPEEARVNSCPDCGTTPGLFHRLGCPRRTSTGTSHENAWWPDEPAPPSSETEQTEARVDLVGRLKAEARSIRATRDGTFSDGMAEGLDRAASIAQTQSPSEGEVARGHDATVLENLAWNIDQANVIAKHGTMGPTAATLRRVAENLRARASSSTPSDEGSAGTRGAA